MAEGGYDPSIRQRNGPRPKINQVCRYYLHGSCIKGDQCSFLHDRSRAVPQDNVCKFYQFGKCAYGNRCRYEHVKTDKLRGEPNPRSEASQPARPHRGNSGSPRGMVTLRKGGLEHSMAEAERTKTKRDFEKKWVQAKDFVPGQKYYGAVPSSYASAVHSKDNSMCNGVRGGGLPVSEITADSLLCPYYALGECPYGDGCEYVHGDICDMCGMPQLHPANLQQRENHEQECLRQHEHEMELAFAIQESQDKECGICLEVIMDKAISKGSRGGGSYNRFGILENCNHCFCLDCIRQWRSNKSATIETHKACPTCRTHSDFVTPSKYWVESPERKKNVIDAYKAALSKKPCQYFKRGRGVCPFNEKCFYQHALEDGTIVSSNVRKLRRRKNAEGENVGEEECSLWDFISRRDGERGFLSIEDELSLVLLGIFQDSDDDDDDNNNYGIRFNFHDGDFVFTDTDTDSDFDF